MYRKGTISFRAICVFIACAIFVSGIMFFADKLSQDSYVSALPYMSVPSKILATTAHYSPPVLRGIRVHPDDPFKFSFILDEGDSKLGEKTLEDESAKLIRYFLAALTIPEDDLWVNLSPYEEDRVITKSLGITDMGRDMLGEDYILKQLVSSLTYPESSLGKQFWDRIYARTQELYGTINIPINTFNKVWIFPESATIHQDKNKAFITKAKLKVMLEEDYVALNRSKSEVLSERSESKGLALRATDQRPQTKDRRPEEIRGISSKIMRQIVLPEIEKEINNGKNFVQLRQMYHSLLLANWFKQQLKQHIVNQIYADKNKVNGIDIDDPQIKEKIYQQYVEAYKKGVYDYIKKEYDASSRKHLNRRYFSGGIVWSVKDVMNSLTHDDIAKDPLVVAFIEKIKCRDIEVQLDILKTKRGAEHALGKDITSEDELGAVWDAHDYGERGASGKFSSDVNITKGLKLMRSRGSFPGYSRINAKKLLDEEVAGRQKISIDKRFDELSKECGAKAARLMILQERGLDKKLGFEIPPFVTFEEDFLKEIFERYGKFWKTHVYSKIKHAVEESVLEKGRFVVRWLSETHANDIETILLNFYFECLDDEVTLRQKILDLVRNEFSVLTEYSSEGEWVDFFVNLREAPDIKRALGNKDRVDPMPDYEVNREARRKFKDVIENYLFSKTLPEGLIKSWREKIKHLGMHKIWRSSRFGEDSFEKSWAGFYMSRCTDDFQDFYMLHQILKPPHDVVSDRYQDVSYSVFLQKYSWADKSGIAFSNLEGYTTIEGVVGEGEVAVGGSSNVIIDIRRDIDVIDHVYQEYDRRNGSRRRIKWKGFYLGPGGMGGYHTDEQIAEYTNKKWQENAVVINDASGRQYLSPFSEEEIREIKTTACEIEEDLGFPVDMEFFFKDGQLNVVQVRPITGDFSQSIEALPEFEEEDVLARMPIAIGKTTIDGLVGFITSDVSVFGRKELDLIAKHADIPFEQVFLTTDGPTDHSEYLVLLTPRFASRIHHHGINFRENGTVVLGARDFFKSSVFRKLKWKKLPIEDEYGRAISITEEPVKVYANGFRGLIVKADAKPIKSFPEGGKKFMTLDQAHELLNWEGGRDFGNDLDKTKRLAGLIVKENDSGINKVLIVGSGQRNLPTMLALMGKEVTCVSMERKRDRVFMMDAEEQLEESGLDIDLKVNFILGEIGSLDIDDNGLTRGSYDLVTFIDLVGGDPTGKPKQWLLKAKELLKPDGYVVIDIDPRGKDTIVRHFDDVFPEARLVSRGIGGTYNSLATNWFLQIGAGSSSAVGGIDFDPTKANIETHGDNAQLIANSGDLLFNINNFEGFTFQILSMDEITESTKAFISTEN
ncbi:MAG: hypothetical protein GY858_09410 [Candidatus Omnitrophica bacterium]|nr:hypothetical protein [Candidatus Omnitrophota bacterium]